MSLPKPKGRNVRLDEAVLPIMDRLRTALERSINLGGKAGDPGGGAAKQS